MAPVLFLFLVMAFAETLEEEWDDAKLTKPLFSRQEIIPTATAQLVSHKVTKKHSPRTTKFQLFCMLYVDDGAFTFTSRRDLEIGAELVHKKFARFGLEMHIGRGSKTSKTECIYFPPPGHFPEPTSTSTTLTSTQTSISSYHQPNPLSTTSSKKTQENALVKRKRENEEYDKCEETNDVKVSDGVITFTQHFKYLGSWLSYWLGDDYDVAARIGNANKAMGALRWFWNDKKVDKRSKYLTFLAIPINLLLWGCESWALKTTLLAPLEVFLHRSIRSILGINILQVREEKLKNSELRKRFYNILTIREEIAKRQLTFIGKLTRRDNTHIPTLLLSSWCDNPRKKGGVRKTNRKSVVESLQLLLPDQVPHSGVFNTWVHLAQDKSYWNLLLSRIGGSQNNPPSSSQQSRAPPPPRSQSPPPPQSPPQSPQWQPPPSPPTPIPPPNRSAHPTPTPPRNSRQQTSPPPRANPRSSNQSGTSSNNSNFLFDKIGKTKRDSLLFLNLPLDASERDVKIRYRHLARIYHPDKYDSQHQHTGMTLPQTVAHFQHISNAHSFLRDTL